MGDLSLGAGGSLSRESLSGGSLSMEVRVSVRRPPAYGNERAVRILLECILFTMLKFY